MGMMDWNTPLASVMAFKKGYLTESAADDAHKLGLTSAGGQWWKDSSGKVKYQSYKGRLVPIGSTSHGVEDTHKVKKKDYGFASLEHKNAHETHKAISEDPEVDADKEHHSALAQKHADAHAHFKKLKDEADADEDASRVHGHHQDRKIDDPEQINSTSLDSVIAQHDKEAASHHAAHLHHSSKAMTTEDKELADWHQGKSEKHQRAREQHKQASEFLRNAAHIRSNLGIRN